MRDILIGNKRARLQIWDTAGQEAYRSIAQSYYRGAAVAFLVYDITNRISFTNLEAWLCDARKYGSQDMLLFVIGNKCDLEKDRCVSFNEGEDFAKQNGVGFVETSAKVNTNVEDAFVGTARRIVREINEGHIDPRTFPGIKLSTEQLRSYQGGGTMSQNIVLCPTEDEEDEDAVGGKKKDGCCK